jgi:predicted lipid-binding transport protein (Tim44 family)
VIFNRSGASVIVTFAVASICLGVAARVAAQEIYAYPTRGQSAQQQDRDRYECHNWARQQTGYDPANQAPATTVAAPLPQAAPPPSFEPRGGLLQGAMRGSALGAVGGAIAGDAGKGAGIGAATGALFGGMRRREAMRAEEERVAYYEQQRAYQQQSAAASASASSAQLHAAYTRAMTACLHGRGYSVN